MYGVSENAVGLRMVSNFKFAVSVTANSASPTAENSCTYEYNAPQRDVTLRHYTLVKYDLGAQRLLPGANVFDGCITELSSENGPLNFSNNSAVCGSTYDTTGRFKRYFGNVVLKFNYLDIANAVFNISV
ncbi:hypothetical protein HDU79_002431, partial [Rhizoclosmatium sp. JEL0117]